MKAAALEIALEIPVLEVRLILEMNKIFLNGGSSDETRAT
jgi:hypothetical protein